MADIAKCSLQCLGDSFCIAECVYRAEHGGNDPPKPTNNQATDADYAACQVEGEAYLGPNYLGLYDGAGTDYNDMKARVTTWCKREGESATQDQVRASWSWLDQFTGTWGALNQNQKTCARNYIKTNEINWDRQVLDLIAQGCSRCDYWWKGGQCDHPLIPIIPMPPKPQPLVPSIPASTLCSPGQPCLADLVPIPPLLNLEYPVTWNLLADLVPPANGPVVPITVSWWREFEDEIIADLSDLFISPEYLAIILALDIPIIMTQDYRYSLLFTVLGLMGPLGLYAFHKIMFKLKVLIWDIKKTYAEFEQFEYPLLYAIIAQSAVFAVIYGEKWMSIPAEIEGYSFLIGEGIVLGGTGIVWFLGTAYGKAFTDIGSSIFSFLDSICSTD